MPITYEIDKTRRLIRTQCVGHVSFDEVMQHFGTLEQDPGCPERLDVLLNLTELTSVPETHQLRHITEKIAHVQSKIKFEVCAIVSDTDLLFGLARMFVVFAEERFRATHVFRKVDDAEKWLISQQLADS